MCRVTPWGWEPSGLAERRHRDWVGRAEGPEGVRPSVRPPRASLAAVLRLPSRVRWQTRACQSVITTFNESLPAGRTNFDSAEQGAEKRSRLVGPSVVTA